MMAESDINVARKSGLAEKLHQSGMQSFGDDAYHGLAVFVASMKTPSNPDQLKYNNWLASYRVHVSYRHFQPLAGSAKKKINSF